MSRENQLVIENPFAVEFNGELTFEDASTLWLGTRVGTPGEGRISPRYIKPTTERDFRGCLRTLGLFFGRRKLSDIKPRELTQYQDLRTRGEAPFIRPQRAHGTANDRCPVGARVVNKELDVLVRLLKRAGCWTHLFEHTFERLLETESELPEP